ncbi:thermonuclease family protein [Caldimonas sp. KR1-144]|uniref:thermonuclease family protein n=1 Tax=Caldimonas sp. KR1-144 TaxID=3400911 RepID=UPI003C0CD96F
MRSLAICLLALCVPLAQAQPERFAGTVTRVSDGDTLWVRPQAGDGSRPRPVKLRLVGIDAPERCQAHGDAATRALERQVMGRVVAVERVATDGHGRGLARVSVEGVDVAASLVRAGHAWSSHWRGDPGPYGDEEAAARRARRGLFADANAIEPWRFRRAHGPCEAVAPSPKGE